MINSIAQQSLFNAAAVNRSIAARSGSTEESGQPVFVMRNDVVDISQKGRVTSLIETLMNNKQNLQERRSELIGETIEGGGSIKDIELILEQYNDQLKGIEDQIAELMQQQLEEAAEESSKKNEKDKPEEESETKRLTNLSFIAGDIKQMEVIDSAKSRLEGRANVIKSELKSDGVSALESKRDELDEINKRIDGAESSLAKAGAEIMEEIKQDQEQKPQEEQEKTQGSLQFPTEDEIKSWVEKQREATATDADGTSGVDIVNESL